GRFHRHARHLTLHQPGGQRLQVRGEGAKGPHRLRVSVRRHAGPNLCGANVQARGRRILHPQLGNHGAFGGPARLSSHRIRPPSGGSLAQTRTPRGIVRCSAGSRGGAPPATIFCSSRVQNQTRKRAPAAPFETPVLACLGVSQKNSTTPFLPPRLAPALWITRNDEVGESANSS